MGTVRVRASAVLCCVVSVCRLPSEPGVTPSPCTPDIDPSQDVCPLIVPGANVRKFRAYPTLRPPNSETSHEPMGQIAFPENLQTYSIAPNV